MSSSSNFFKIQRLKEIIVSEQPYVNILLLSEGKRKNVPGRLIDVLSDSDAIELKVKIHPTFNKVEKREYTVKFPLPGCKLEQKPFQVYTQVYVPPEEYEESYG